MNPLTLGTLIVDELERHRPQSARQLADNVAHASNQRSLRNGVRVGHHVTPIAIDAVHRALDQLVSSGQVVDQGGLFTLQEVSP